MRVGASAASDDIADIAQLERLAALAQVMVDVRGTRDLPRLFFSLDNRWGFVRQSATSTRKRHEGARQIYEVNPTVSIFTATGAEACP